MRLREREECGVVSFVVADQRGIGFDDDRMGMAVGDYSALLAPRVKLYPPPVSVSLCRSPHPQPGTEGAETHLNLINMRRPDLRPLAHLLYMPDAIIANPNTLRLPLIHQLLQRLPHLLPRRRPPTRTVNQKQIHIPLLAVDLGHALPTLPVRGVGAAARGEDLGRDEDVFARDAGLADGVPDFGFVLVVLRRVDVAVAGAQGGQARFRALRAVRLVDAEAEAGDPDGAVGEGEEVG